MEQLEIRYNFYCLDFCYHEESTLFCRVNSWDIAVEKQFIVLQQVNNTNLLPHLEAVFKLVVQLFRSITAFKNKEQITTIGGCDLCGQFVESWEILTRSFKLYASH